MHVIDEIPTVDKGIGAMLHAQHNLVEMGQGGTCNAMAPLVQFLPHAYPPDPGDGRTGPFRTEALRLLSIGGGIATALIPPCAR